MLTFGRDMLSKRLTSENAEPRQPRTIDLVGSYGLANRLYRLQVPRHSPLIGRSVAQVQAHCPSVVPVGLEKRHHGRVQFVPATPETIFEADDAIFVVGDQEQTGQLIASHDLAVLPRLSDRQRHEVLQEVGVVEIMLAPESALIGKTLRETDFHLRYGLSAVAIGHRGEALTANLEDQTLDFGDTLLVTGGWANIRRLRDDRENFVVLTLPVEYSELMPARRRAPVAVGIVVAMVLAMAVELVPNSVAALLAALALIASGCVKLEAVYRIVNWRTLVLVAGMLPLATALAKTGTTAMMANGMVAVLGSLGPLAVLATVFLVTAVVGLFISNSATAVLMAPVAIDAARVLHNSPQAFAMTVAIGCCAAYVTPVSSAVNTLVMEPGGYTFGDYVRPGVPLLLLTMVVTIVLASIIYRF
jgi:di/tricarboxylate transporter